jgi:hypothetical protein
MCSYLADAFIQSKQQGKREKSEHTIKVGMASK